MEATALVVERKIIGVLIRAAREKAHCTVKQVAEHLGLAPRRVRQYERGLREPSLPELETLSLYLRVPLSFFLGSESSVEEQEVPCPGPEEVRIRRAMIGAQLKQARLAAGKSQEDCAREIERKPATIGRWERGLADIPITDLQRLATFLGVNLYCFLRDGNGRRERVQVLDLEALARLPPEVRAFVLKPTNLPYLRMAMKFGDLPTEKLKELGEILLVVR